MFFRKMLFGNAKLSRLNYRYDGKIINPLSFLGLYTFDRGAEYSWVLENLQLKEGKVLDVGCGGGFLAYELALRGYDTYAIDVRSPLVRHPRLKFYQEDVRATFFPDGFFDRIIAASTIEHIGLGAYGDPRYDEGDFLAMAELKRILSTSGKMLITLPFAIRSSTTWVRTYDRARLRRLISGLLVEKEDYFTSYGTRILWIKVSGDRCKPKGIICLRLTKV